MGTQVLADGLLDWRCHNHLRGARDEGMALTHGSLFSGIGGIDLGFDRAGIETLWQVENDPYAIKVLEKHWPNVRRYTDVREVHAKVAHASRNGRKPRRPKPRRIDGSCSSCLSIVDIISGGFPCQDVSTAGKGAGIKEGTRSGLWLEFFRLIGELRPRYVVVENVAALLYRGLGQVLGDLSEIGYDAEWETISAEALGAPHLRERVFIVAYPGGIRRQQRDKLPEGQQYRTGGQALSQSDAPSSLQGATEVAYPKSERLQQSVNAKGGENPAQRTNEQPVTGTRLRKRDGCDNVQGWWSTEPNVGRVAHGVPSRVDRLKCLGNAVVPIVASFIGECIVNAEKEVNL